MSSYRIVKALVPGRFNVERFAGVPGRDDWIVVGYAFDSQNEAQKYVLQLREKEAAATWTPGEVVWKED